MPLITSPIGKSCAHYKFTSKGNNNQSLKGVEWLVTISNNVGTVNQEI